MKKAVGYVRVSTAGQVGEDKFGKEAQKQMILAFASQNDTEIVEWYEEDAVSGVKEERPVFDRMIYTDELQEKGVNTVIVAKSDRLARQIKLYYYFMFMLERRDIKLVSATEPVVNDESGLGDIYRSLLLFCAEQERLNIAKRTMTGKKVKAAQGGFAGGKSPYGYKSNKGTLIIDEAEAKIVRLIFDYKRTGASINATARMLNESNHKSRSGGDFFPSTIRGIINNEKFYHGYYKFDSDEWIKGQHEAILKR